MIILPPIAKRVIEKNSVEWVGRKIEIGKLKINYFRFSVTIKEFKLFEEDAQSNFVSFDRLYFNFNPWPLFSDKISVSAFELENPEIILVQKTDTTFNFEYLMESGDTTIVEETIDSLADEAPLFDVKFSIDNIKLIGGHMTYNDELMAHKMEMEDINLSIPHIAWDNKQSNLGLDFDFGEDGSVHVDGTLHPTEETYALNLALSNIDLGFISNYLTDYMLIDSLKGKLNSKIQLKGSLRETMDFVLGGSAEVKGLSITEVNRSEWASAKSVGVVFDKLHPYKNNYKFSSMWIEEPVVQVTLADSITNLEKVFAPLMVETDSLEKTTETPTTEEETIFYSIDSIWMKNGKVSFNDETLGRSFHYYLLDIDFETHSIVSTSNQVPLNLSINLNNAGEFKGNGMLDPMEPYNFKFDGAIKNMSLTSLSPYTEYYIAAPVTRGRLDYDVSVDMTPNSLKNENKIKINRIRFGDKVKNETAIKLPIKLAIYMVENPKGIVDFDFPVKGNPSDPSFRVGPIIWKTVTNTILKVTTSPINILGKLVTTNPEKLKQVAFEYGQDSLTDSQIETLNTLVSIQKKKPELTFTYIQETSLQKEKEAIAIEAVKNQFLQTNPTSNNIDNANSEFLIYVNQQVANEQTSLGEKCIEILGQDKVDELFNNVIEKRNKVLESFFANHPEGQALKVKIRTADLRNIAQEQQSPKFRIEVGLDD